MPRRAAPDSPHNADSGPQASVAAFHSPSRPTVGRPTEYTPGQRRNSRPERRRCRIASALNPRSRSWPWVITSCCERASRHDGIRQASGSPGGVIAPFRPHKLEFAPRIGSSSHEHPHLRGRRAGRQDHAGPPRARQWHHAGDARRTGRERGAGQPRPHDPRDRPGRQRKGLLRRLRPRAVSGGPRRAPRRRRPPPPARRWTPRSWPPTTTRRAPGTRSWTTR